MRVLTCKIINFMKKIWEIFFSEDFLVKPFSLVLENLYLNLNLIQGVLI